MATRSEKKAARKSSVRAAPPSGSPRGASHELDHILIQGASEHNLKSVEVRIPKRSLVVFTGVSGSGKSSLAFDTLYAEGQRRYVESLSAYARQFLGRLDKPKYETIRGLSPTISIEQKTAGNNPRSTVGTITEIADYLRLLYARIGAQFCPTCQRPVGGQSAEQIVRELSALPHGTKLTLLAPFIHYKKGEHQRALDQARAQGFVRIRLNGEIKLLEEVSALNKRKKNIVEVVVDRLSVQPENLSRLTESVEQALVAGGGELIASYEGQERVFSQRSACLGCGASFPPLTPASFSFNSPQGLCVECNGLGTQIAVDPALVLPNDELSLNQGAIIPWGTDIASKDNWAHGFRAQILAALGIDLNVPVGKLPKKQRRELLEGTGERRYEVKWSGKTGKGTLEVTWEGVLGRLNRGFMTTQSERAKQWYGRFMGETRCAACEGARLKPESRAVRVGELGIAQVSAFTVDEAYNWFSALGLRGASLEIAEEILKEILNRLQFLRAVGLGYLSLDRASPSLSGGEAQRIRLASQVGSELTGVIYILDEPSIGLHQRDNQRLLDTLLRLRDIGNTVVVVEHDEDTIRAADHIVDFGPGAGVHGGEVVYAGGYAGLLKSAKSITGAYLTGKLKIQVPEVRRAASGWLEIVGARENNLRNLTARVPLGCLAVVTGVSGAGKSTLINDILFPAASNALNGSSLKVGAHLKLKGLKQLDKVIDIDQQPIGRTPRSNPATYIKVFDEIRQFFAELPESKLHGYQPGRFSFNVPGGRCESCEGDGVRKVEMHFLADVYVRCEACEGKRFNQATLGVSYKGHHIADILGLTITEALDVFAAHPKIRQPLQVLDEVGVGYLQLGQSSPTLSGGEAQRIKLARELSRRATGRTLYILDEPTTGLHFEDVRKLVGVLQRLVEAGNSVVVIEHNLDVIKVADWVIDMGPEGGPNGGQIVAEGTPEQVTNLQQSLTGQYLKPYL